MRPLILHLRHLLFVLLVVANVASAQEAASLLWEARAGGKTVYLFGTIHVGKADMYPLPKHVETAFNASKALALEADVTDMQAVQAAMPLGMLPAGRTLESELPAEFAQPLQRAAGASGIPIEALRPMKPFLAMLALASLQYGKLGYVPQLGLDHHFAQRAKSAATPIIALESFEAQLRMMDGLSKPLQQAMLKMTLDDIASGKVAPMVNSLVAAWRRGDAIALYELLTSESKRLPAPLAAEFNQKFLTGRNRQMLAGVEKALARTDTLFVAVGALHLIGPGSLNELLEKADYSLKRVTGTAQ
jgi:uncharacterized protein